MQENKTFKHAVKIGNEGFIISHNIWDTVCNKLQGENNKPIWDILDEVGKHTLNRKKYDAREFHTITKEEQSKILNAFSKGITTRLQANINDINLYGLNQIRLFLGEELEQAEETENVSKKEQSEIEPTKQETEQNKQVVSVKGSFGYNFNK